MFSPAAPFHFLLGTLLRTLEEIEDILTGRYFFEDGMSYWEKLMASINKMPGMIGNGAKTRSTASTIFSYSPTSLSMSSTTLSSTKVRPVTAIPSTDHQAPVNYLHMEKVLVQPLPPPVPSFLENMRYLAGTLLLFALLAWLVIHTCKIAYTLFLATSTKAQRDPQAHETSQISTKQENWEPLLRQSRRQVKKIKKIQRSLTQLDRRVNSQARNWASLYNQREKARDEQFQLVEGVISRHMEELNKTLTTLFDTSTTLFDTLFDKLTNKLTNEVDEHILWSEDRIKTMLEIEYPKLNRFATAITKMRADNQRKYQQESDINFNYFPVAQQKPDKTKTPAAIPEIVVHPPVVEATPIVEEATPVVVEEATPVVEEAPPVVVEAPPVVVEEAPPVVVEAPPVVVVVEAPPVVEEASPVVEEATAVVIEEATPIVEEATPIVEEATPTFDEAAVKTPTIEESPVTPPVVEATPIIEETAATEPPVVDDAPVANTAAVEEAAIPEPPLLDNAPVAEPSVVQEVPVLDETPADGARDGSIVQSSVGAEDPMDTRAPPSPAPSNHSADSLASLFEGSIHDEEMEESPGEAPGDVAMEGMQAPSPVPVVDSQMQDAEVPLLPVFNPPPPPPPVFAPPPPPPQAPTPTVQAANGGLIRKKAVPKGRFARALPPSSLFAFPAPSPQAAIPSLPPASVSPAPANYPAPAPVQGIPGLGMLPPPPVPANTLAPAPVQGIPGLGMLPPPPPPPQATPPTSPPPVLAQSSQPPSSENGPAGSSSQQSNQESQLSLNGGRLPMTRPGCNLGGCWDASVHFHAEDEEEEDACDGMWQCEGCENSFDTTHDCVVDGVNGWYWECLHEDCAIRWKHTHQEQEHAEPAPDPCDPNTFANHGGDDENDGNGQGDVKGKGKQTAVHPAAQQGPQPAPSAPNQQGTQKGKDQLDEIDQALLAERSEDESSDDDGDDDEDDVYYVDDDEDDNDDDDSSETSSEYQRRKRQERYEWELHVGGNLKLKPDPEVGDEIDEDEEDEEEAEEEGEDEDEEYLSAENFDTSEKSAIQQLCGHEAAQFKDEAREAREAKGFF
ncbi:hypothetical protein GJ744_011893 [Endocarpon pusillum]|uniref:Uncharacterized protein n=1 Tax=Endocarpon pusillum TaxID=364733 RepID=A0A8H7E2H0_9EURO|nr:hypothetical protein GJ744_011893 [Endocarpon pusillum]